MPAKKTLDAATNRPSVAEVYAKAVWAFLVSGILSASTWATTALGDSRVTAQEWIGLAVAVVTPFAASAAVAKVTNAPGPAQGTEDGHSGIGVALFVVIFLAALLLGGFGSHWFFLLVILALLALFL